MLQFTQTNSDNLDFITLVRQLDADLAIRDGNEHTFYAQFNKIATIKHVIVAYQDNQAIACGAMKEFAPDAMEIKRMYTLPENRGKGIAGQLLTVLECWAAALGYKKCVLETGKRQPEAIALYEKCGYRRIPNYGQYACKDNSVCFEKELSQKQATDADNM